MDPRVAAVLNAQKEKENKKRNQKKEELLLDLELYDKVYAPDNVCTDDYPYFEWDDEKGEGLYFKKVPIAVTDEEYEALKRCTGKDDELTQSNGVATTLTVIAWLIYIGGFIAGIIACSEFRTFEFEVACAVWFDAFVCGTIFLAIAEIIKLLFKINSKLSPAKKAAAEEETDEE